jgi:hypothetical protein
MKPLLQLSLNLDFQDTEKWLGKHKARRAKAFEKVVTPIEKANISPGFVPQDA